MKRPIVAAVTIAAGCLAGCQSLYVSPTGSDAGNCTQKQPCRSFARAYQVAPNRQTTVVVRPGVYPKQTLPAGKKPVVFRGGPGAKIRSIDNNASGISFVGLDVDAAFAKTPGFSSSGDNVVFRDGRIGNVTDEKGALVSGSNFKFDRVVFHDVRVTNPSVHNECVYAIVVPGMTVRNSLFHHCATMDLFFTYGSWWSPLPPAYGNVTLENNVFAHTYKDDGSWHYYSLYVANTANGGGTMSNWTVRNNTFEIAAAIGEKTATGKSRWSSNIGDWSCIPGMTFTHNVGQKCSTSDKRVTPAASTQSQTAPFGWVNPAANDFRLKAGSPALNAADPKDHVATDLVTKSRGSAPDAGALER